ncbi:MAG: AAA family ATPase [Microscillaceae bacterium]|nr:AAA family ATPase [Microscillaceae bacterium]
MAHIQPEIEQYLDFLGQAQSYPEKPDEVQLIQTHASVIALTDQFAYKLKKSVNFGFLDFSTLAQRHSACLEELRLNRRLSKGIYQDVIPIYWDGSRLDFEPIEGEIVNYAVKMRRMQESGFLVNLIQKPDFKLQQMDLLVEKLCDFYQSQEPRPEVLAWGTPEKLSVSIRDNLKSMQEFVGFTVPIWACEIITEKQELFLNHRQGLLLKRIDEGKIQDCHGDLRSEHIYLENDQVHIFDCIEFNESFRFIDQLNDLAFLLMDLEYRGHYDIAHYFAQKIIPKLEEDLVTELLDFYKIYRAAVRGKVNSLKAQEHEIAPKIQEESIQKARHYYQWALKYAVLGSMPTIIAVLGGTATGKSTLSRTLSEFLPIKHLNSDLIRKTLAGVDPFERTPLEEVPRVYSEEMSRKTYEKLLEEGLATVRQEGIVILDATFRQKELMEILHQTTRAAHIRLILVQTTAPEEVIKARLKSREAQKTVSDMRLDTYRPEAFAYTYSIEEFGDLAIYADTTEALEIFIPGLLRKFAAIDQD